MSNTDICEVHFCNRTSDCSLVVEPYWEDGKYIADIPNVLLQTARPIRIYAYIDDAYTLDEEQFSVKARTKPADYVYTETEVKSYDALEKKLNEIEEQGFSEETVTKAVEGYLADHPTDLSAYATKEELPTKVSDLDNDAGYLTEHIDISGKADKGHTHSISEVTDYVAPDLSPYAKTSDIPSIEGLATETFVTESINNIPAADFSNYYNKTETENIVNEAVGNISIPDISTKADKEHTHSISDIVDYKEPDLTGYAKTEDIPSVEGLATEEYVDKAVAGATGTDLSDYYTKGETDTAIKNAVDAIDIPEVDFTGYATEQFVNDAVAAIDIPTVPKVVSAFTNDAGYLTKVPEEYASKVYVNAAIAKIDIPDTSDLATKVYVNTKVTEIRDEIPDVSELASKTYVNNKVAAIPDIDLSDYASKAYVDAAVDNVDVDLSNYATKSYVNTQINNIPEPDLTGYATQAYVNTKVNNIHVPTNISELNNDAGYIKTVPAEYVTDAELDNKGFATKSYVNDAIANLDIPEADVDLSNYYTKSQTYNRTEIDNKIANAGSGGTVDLDNYYTKDEVDGLIPFVPTEVGDFNNNVGYITWDETKGYTYSKEEVDNAIANIPGGGGDSGDLDITIYDDGKGNVTIDAIPSDSPDVPTGDGASHFILPDLSAANTWDEETGERPVFAAPAELVAFAEAVIANNGHVVATMFTDRHNAYSPVAIYDLDMDSKAFNFTHYISGLHLCHNSFRALSYRIWRNGNDWEYQAMDEADTQFVAIDDLMSEMKRHHISIDIRHKNIGDTGDTGEIGDDAVSARYVYRDWNCTPVITLRVTNDNGNESVSQHTSVVPYGNNGIAITGTFKDDYGNVFCRKLVLDIKDDMEYYSYESESAPSTLDWWAHGEYELSNITSYTHVRLVIEWNNDSTRRSLHDIADDSGNSIQSHHRYYIADNYGYCVRQNDNLVALRYNPEQQIIEAENADGDILSVDGAHIVGYYHWGY